MGTDRIGRSASFEVEPTLLQHVTSPTDAERPNMRYDAERRNEGEIAYLITLLTPLPSANSISMSNPLALLSVSIPSFSRPLLVDSATECV